MPKFAGTRANFELMTPHTVQRKANFFQAQNFLQAKQCKRLEWINDIATDPFQDLLSVSLSVLELNAKLTNSKFTFRDTWGLVNHKVIETPR